KTAVGVWPHCVLVSVRVLPWWSKTKTPLSKGNDMTKIVDSAAEAVANIADGSTVLIGGFGNAGQPMELIGALLDGGAKNLTIVNNNAGQADEGLALLIKERRVDKIICSFPRQSDSWHFDEA